MLASAPFVLVTGAILPHDLRPADIFAVVVTCLGVAVGGVVCLRRPHLLPDYFWTGAPFLATTLITGMDLVTADASTGAQLFYLWPVLYAATFLSRLFVYLTLLVVFAGEAAVLFPLVRLSLALSDMTAMMLALGMSAVVVVTLRERRDQLLSVLETQALADPLTGLGNRRSFDRDLAHADAWVRRTGGSLSLLTVDVDHFKMINDTWGHAVGDLALQSVARSLRSAARETDVVARLGGDEFVVLMRCDRRGALRVAGAVRAAVAACDDLAGGPPQLSIGLAVLPDDADTVEGLLAASDAALYEAKVGGRNRVASSGQRADAARTAGL
jgi:diguanylate cyclase (GGDEF)-like protein